MKNKVIYFLSVLSILGLCIAWNNVYEYRNACEPRFDEYYINDNNQKIYLYKDYCYKQGKSLCETYAELNQVNIIVVEGTEFVDLNNQYISVNQIKESCLQ